MTYTTIQTIEAAGVPYVEYRPQPEVNEDVLITIEFTPEPQSPDSDYQYTQPEFAIMDMIWLKVQLEYCEEHQIPETQLKQFRICAMELVDCVTPSGQLLTQPYWKYGIRNGAGDLVWLEEQALVRVALSNPDWF